MKQDLFSVINSEGLRFNIRLVCKGDKYGLNDCLTHDDNEPLVEFYDDRYPHTEYGQFVGRYNLSILDGSSEYSNGGAIGSSGAGLCLDGGVPSWSIDALSCQMVLRWLSHVTA